jgi:hypothetical protein
MPAVTSQLALARPRWLRLPAPAASGDLLLSVGIVAAVVVRLSFWLYTS